MPELKTIDSLLKDLGYDPVYISTNKNDFVDSENDKRLIAQTKTPLGQRIDFVTKLRAQNTSHDQLTDILGTRYVANDYSTSNNNDDKTSIEHKYEANEQLRAERFDELLKTEENYIRKLQPLVNTIVKPLKLSCAESKHPVLKQYLCTNIFLNLEQILDLHQQFLKDLKTHHKEDYADLCSTYMGKMDRYRRYLLKVNEAHELHTTEYQNNQVYRRFIINATTNPSFQKLRFDNLLDEPWKRITAYVVLLEDIRNHTPVDHPDFVKLTDAFTQINTIASVRDDLPTILATKSHDLYLSIRKAPCHLINQSRSLVTHLDTVEINGITGKVTRHVTLFLFCDKIMVASRSSHAKGTDICDDGSPSGSTPLTNLVPKKKKNLDFKFCGWIGLHHIDLIQGPSDLPGAFMVRASSDFQDGITETGYEKYFKKYTRIFAYQAEPYSQPPVDFIKKKDAFVEAFYKTQAVKRQYGNQDATYHRHWNGHQLYSNLYDFETFTKTQIKNNVVAIFLEKDSEVDIPSLLNSSQSSPWIVALVRPESQGSKLSIWSKIPLDYHQNSTSRTTPSPCELQDFTSVFWNNVIKCSRKLQCTSTYQLMNGGLDEEETRYRHRSRSRPRTSMTRSTSISSISKIFGRSRSQSPFSASTTQLTLSPSKSTPTRTQQDEITSTMQLRPRAHSLSSEQTCPDAKSKPTTRRRRLSFDASIFKIAIKSPITSSVSTTAQQPKSSTQKNHQFSPQTHIQQLQNSIRRKSLSQNTKNHYQSTAVPIPIPSNTRPPLVPHPTDIPSPNIHSSSQRTLKSISVTPPSTSFSLATKGDGGQRQLQEKLENIYHDMAGIGKLITKDPQQQPLYTSDSLVSSRPPSRTSSCSPVSISSPNGHFGNISPSSRSSSYINTFSSYASQSSRSSISLEEMDSMKGYGPPPRLASIDMVPLSSSQHIDDEIARKVMTELASSHRKWSQKSLAPHYVSAIDDTHVHQPSPPPTISTPIPSLRPATTMEKQQQHQRPALDYIASVVDHCSYQVGSKWQFLLDKQRMLGNQVKRAADLLPYDADTGMLNEMYRSTMNETAHFFNEISAELEEISTTMNAYRQQPQQQSQLAPSPLDTSPAYATHDPDMLLKRKMKEVQLERDYWHRRASDLSNQLNNFVLKQ